MPAITAKKQTWHQGAVARDHAVLGVLESQAKPLTDAEITERFTAGDPWQKRLPPPLGMLVAVDRDEPDEADYSRS